MAARSTQLGQKVEEHLAFAKRHLERFSSDASYVAGYRSAVSDAAHLVDAIRTEVEGIGRSSTRKTEIVQELQKAGDAVFEMRKLLPESAGAPPDPTGNAALTVAEFLLAPDINWNEAVRRLKQMRSTAASPEAPKALQPARRRYSR